ncbi:MULTISPECIES: class A beta-lactamase [Bacteroidales]|uniref:class A beta-lactamase n=1 Tax=Bacteroidales TaxID=171549 RepID=UPI0023F06F62|nr:MULTISPECIES: class A beta-lactamase [Bacteroidales]MCX4285305.1 class A beta-lactamase [Duncaniella dubosii]
MGDETGHYTVKAVKGDALVFSYVGTVSDTIKVENERLDVKLKLYIPGEDEYVYVDSIRSLQNELTSFVENKDARIGIAVIINGKDTVSVNGSKDFPMMSVFKFPLALAVAKWVDSNGMSLNDSIAFGPKALIKDTYSPMLKKYGSGLYKMSFKELLEWSLIESDNNAADLLLKRVGGTACATTLLKDVAGELDITIGASEQNMHQDPYTSYLNRSTPLAMATLFDRFDTEIKNRSKSFSDISVMLEQCRTGLDRLAAPFIATNAIVGHKTGTGFPTPEGRISAINDCGYIHLPNGTQYTIAVFVADSAYDMTETSKIIADISEIVFKSLIGSK